MYVDVKNFDAYFKAQKLQFCEFWFSEGVGGQMYVDAKNFDACMEAQKLYFCEF